MLCVHRQPEWKDEHTIMEGGFGITTTADLIRSIYEQLTTTEGDISKGKFDYDTRRGLTQKPITDSNQWSICITHSYIDCTNWFVKVLGRMNAKYFRWIERQTCFGDHIRKGTERVKKIIEKNTGLRLSQVNKSNDGW